MERFAADLPWHSAICLLFGSGSPLLTYPLAPHTIVLCLKHRYTTSEELDSVLF